MKKDKKIPIIGPAEREDLDFTNAACLQECTGLIQVPPQNEDELENYNDVYRFEPNPNA